MPLLPRHLQARQRNSSRRATLEEKDGYPALPVLEHFCAWTGQVEQGELSLSLIHNSPDLWKCADRPDLPPASLHSRSVSARNRNDVGPSIPPLLSTLRTKLYISSSCRCRNRLSPRPPGRPRTPTQARDSLNSQPVVSRSSSVPPESRSPKSSSMYEARLKIEGVVSTRTDPFLPTGPDHVLRA